MKVIFRTPMLLAVLALAACGGTTDGGDPVQGVDFVISSGIISDIEVPTDAQLDELPREVARVVREFTVSNSIAGGSGTAPSGDADYNGTFAFGFDGEDNDASVAGDINVTVDFLEGLVTGQMSAITVYDDEGEQLTTNGGVLEIRGETPDNKFTASAQGDILLEGETYGIDAALAGDFAGEGFARGLGTINGTVSNPDGSDEGLEGLYVFEKLED